MKAATPDRFTRIRQPLPEDLYPIALELGVRLGLQPRHLQTLRDVARYHDIGKRAPFLLGYSTNPQRSTKASGSSSASTRRSVRGY
jgi:hypothetical protein